MKINRDNYESFFTDYLDGNLEAGKMDEFSEFILKNPDLEEELCQFEKVRLPEGKEHFGKKERLYKEELDHQAVFNQAAVAWLEGDSDPEETLALRNYLEKHPDRKKEMELFRLTRLIPDLSQRFPAPKRLYRLSRTRKLMTWGMRTAAVFLLAWGIYALLQHPWSLPENERTTASQTYPSPGNLPAQPDQPTMKNPAEITGTTVTEPAFTGEMATGSDAKIKPLIHANTLVKNEQNKIFPKPEAGKSDPGLTEITDGQESVTPRNPALPGMPEPLSPVRGNLSASVEKAELALPSGFPLPEAGSPQQSLAALKNTKYKKALSGLNAGKILLAGILAAEDLTNEKFNVKTNRQGDIVAWEIDTRLVGLSVPVRKKE